MRIISIAALLLSAVASGASAQGICTGYGPQTPRDISAKEGTNPRLWTLAPEASALNLCNIHAHVNAEHKGPGFSLSAGADAAGGYQCNETTDLTAVELSDPTSGTGAMHGVKPGDTIEVHWVFSSCDVAPGEGLGACLSDKCANPELRVEAQAFLLVIDPMAADFADYAHPTSVTGLSQPSSLPESGKPVVFAGSTTGPSYSDAVCSPLQVTWSVRPTCQKLNIASLHEWAMANPFNEDHAHGVRPLVTAPELLSAISD